jgi:hypothetical protein
MAKRRRSSYRSFRQSMAQRERRFYERQALMQRKPNAGAIWFIVALSVALALTGLLTFLGFKTR